MKTLSDSDIKTDQRQDVYDKIIYNSKKCMTSAAFAITLTGSSAFILSGCVDSDVTSFADASADSRDVGITDVGQFQDTFDVGRYDVGDRDVTTFGDS